MERSPCFDCVRKNEDKKACAKICERLKAYQRGGPWKLCPIPGGEVIEKHTTPKDEDKDTTDQALAKLVKITEQKPKRKKQKTEKGKAVTNAMMSNANDTETKTSVDDTPEVDLCRSKATPAAEQEVAGAGYGVYIDFTLYPELRGAISARAQALMLPESHIILSLAAEALSNGG